MTVTSPSRISQLWQRFRAPTKEFKRSHIEEMFTILREQQAQIEQLEAPVKEVMAQSEDFDGVNTIAYVRALHKKMEGQRKHIAALQAQVAARNEWQPMETAPKDGTPILVSNDERDGVWVAYYQPVYTSGYRPDNPWSSLMLNTRWHKNKWASYVPTRWMPLPAPPAVEAREQQP